jgi:hypothetical protein
MNPELVERLDELAKHHGPEIAAWRDWFELCEGVIPKLDIIIAATTPAPDSGSETNRQDLQAELAEVQSELDALLAKHGLFRFNIPFAKLNRLVARLERFRQQQEVKQQSHSETPAESGGAELSETPAEEVPLKRRAKN